MSNTLVAVLQTAGLFMMVDGASGTHFQQFIVQSPRNERIEHIGMFIGAVLYCVGVYLGRV